MAKKTEYLVIGSDNFWYGICSTKKEALQLVEEVKEAPHKFGDPEHTNSLREDVPEMFYIYKAEEVDRVEGEELEDEEDEEE